MVGKETEKKLTMVTMSYLIFPFKVELNAVHVMEKEYSEQE